VLGQDLFAGTYARGGAGTAVTAEAWLEAMVDAEAALAAACVDEGLISAQAGEAIQQALQQGPFDAAAIAAEAGNHATPVVPLVRELRARVGEQFADAVHLGATSQDIVDTAAMLVSLRACQPILADAHAVMTASARLAFSHRNTPVAGRTLLQQALPTSFGLLAAGWMAGVQRATEELEHALAGALAKVARDVVLMAQSELGELREGAEGRGGSSAMAHKHNPVASVSVIACAHRAPGLVASIFAAMEQELQRAAGAWQSEWGTLSDLLTLTGSAAAWCADLLENLEVDPERMRENLARLAAAGVAAAEHPEEHLAGAAELIDRALAEVKL
jgi:3-carboxy-cis,cis-muconate cycloisomerase